MGRNSLKLNLSRKPEIRAAKASGTSVMKNMADEHQAPKAGRRTFLFSHATSSISGLVCSPKKDSFAKVAHVGGKGRGVGTRA